VTAVSNIGTNTLCKREVERDRERQRQKGGIYMGQRVDRKEEEEEARPRWSGTNSVATKGTVGSVNLLTIDRKTKMAIGSQGARIFISVADHSESGRRDRGRQRE
jgi:hypothetical protein